MSTNRIPTAVVAHYERAVDTLLDATEARRQTAAMYGRGERGQYEYECWFRQTGQAVRLGEARRKLQLIRSLCPRNGVTMADFKTQAAAPRKLGWGRSRS